MDPIKLNNERAFALKRYEKQARLIVYKNGAEEVCRKETFGRLERFIKSDERHIFKGRLQLRKNSAGIGIEVKGELAGIIKTEVFVDLLEGLKKAG